MKKIIASLLAVLLVSSTISPAVAANIADVKSSIAFSKIENYVTSASSLTVSVDVAMLFQYMVRLRCLLTVAVSVLVPPEA